MTPDDLVKLSHSEILSELWRDLPFHGFDEPTQEGFADALKTAVADAPQRFVPIAPKMFGADIPPIYTHYALWGFCEAWKKGTAFDWGPVLELCRVVSQTRDVTAVSGEPPDMAPGYWESTYASSRSAVASLLETAVVDDNYAIPENCLEQVRDILLVLADDTNPSPEYERKWGIEHPSGVLGLALNVVRAKAVGALLEYALHIARLAETSQEPVEELFSPGSRIEKAVKDKLAEKLDKQVDASLAVHSQFGKYLPNLFFLDEQWAITHLEGIFPRRREMQAFWESAWDGYLFRSDFFGYLFELLKPYYRYALEQMKLGVQREIGVELSRGRIARHLAAVYWHAIKGLDDDDFLIPLFFDVAPDDLRAGFVTGLEVSLREAKPKADSGEWARAKALWHARFHAIFEATRSARQTTDFTMELGAFTGWVPYVPDDLSNFYTEIEWAGLACESWRAIRLLRYLATVADHHTVFSVSFLEKLLKKNREPWFLAGDRETVRTIVEASLHSGDEQAKSCAVRVINILGERGDEGYRDLLRLS